MRKHQYLIAGIVILLFTSLTVNHLTAQVKIGNNPSAINAASLLELESTNKGILLPRLNDTSSISNAPQGMFIFSNADSSLYFKRTQSWQKIFNNSDNLWRDDGNAVISIGKVGIETPGVPVSILQVIDTSTTAIRGINLDETNNTSIGDRIFVRKARGTPTFPLSIVSGDILGSYTWSAYDGNEYDNAAKIMVTSKGVIGIGKVPGSMSLQTANSNGVINTAISIDTNQVVSFTQPNDNSINRGFSLSSRDVATLAVPVPTLRPTTANSLLALDLMPNGIPPANGNGATWMDVCDADILNNNAALVHTARVAIRPTFAEFGSRVFNGLGAKGVRLTVENSTGIVAGVAIDTSGTKIGFGGDTSFLNPMSLLVSGTGGFRLTNLALGTGAGIGTLFGIDASGNTYINNRSNFSFGLYTNNTQWFNLNATGKSFFGGSSSGTAWVTTAAGTSTIPPIQLTSGTNTTIPVSGAIEYNGSHFYGSTSAGARKQLDNDNYPAIVSSAYLSGQTSVGNITSYATGGEDSSYQISAYLDVTSISINVMAVQVSYTDETSTKRTALFYNQGTVTGNITVTGPSTFSPLAEIRVKANTTISVSTINITNGGSNIFNASATITRLHG